MGCAEYIKGVQMTNTKTFEYEENGLSYSVTIRQDENGKFVADITVNEGFMDVNAVYYGDDDFSGPSAGLRGPLNMNGGGSRFEGENVQWDNAIALSSPGLGRMGANKPTYLSEGDTLTVELPISGLDEIEYFGIRATSTSTPEGSIKGVSGNPDTEDENGDDPDNGDDGDATYEKVFFVKDPEAGAGNIYEWDNISPELLEQAGLQSDAEATFANYVAVFEVDGYFDLSDLQEVRFFEPDGNGVLQELADMRIEAPEGGFEDTNAMISAYDEMIAETSGDWFEGLMISMTSDDDADVPVPEDEDDEAISVFG